MLAFCKTDQVDRCWHSSHFSSTCVRSCFVVEKVPRGAEVAIRHRLNSAAAAVADDLFGHKPAKLLQHAGFPGSPINAKTKTQFLEFRYSRFIDTDLFSLFASETTFFCTLGIRGKALNFRQETICFPMDVNSNDLPVFTGFFFF